MKNRNISIDIIKGIGIILMVGGHCGMPFTHFIYLFHMKLVRLFLMKSIIRYVDQDVQWHFVKK